MLLSKIYSYDQIKNNVMGRACGMDGERRGPCRVLVMEPEGKRQFGRLRNRRVDNNKIHLQDVGCERVDRIVLAQNRDNWKDKDSSLSKRHVSH